MKVTLDLIQTIQKSLPFISLIENSFHFLSSAFTDTDKPESGSFPDRVCDRFALSACATESNSPFV
jgi:hypothetical protein